MQAWTFPLLFISDHIFNSGFATSFPLPAGELKLASNSRYESAELRARAEYKTDNERNRAAEERERAAFRARRQAQCNLVQLRDVISLLEEYGGFA